MSLFQVEDLDVSYEGVANALEKGQREPVRLRDVSFSLDAGSIADVVGPSGNGKSMLFRALALMMERQSGVLYLEGQPDDAFAPEQWRRNVCLVPQQAALVPGTIRENLLLPWTLRVNAAATRPTDEELASMLEAARLEVSLDQDAVKLSGGQIARVAMARVLLTHPKVLLLDEVDAALDEESSHAMSLLTLRAAEEGAACLRIRHRISDGLATQTLRVQDGALTVEAPQPAKTGDVL